MTRIDTVPSVSGRIAGLRKQHIRESRYHPIAGVLVGLVGSMLGTPAHATEDGALEEVTVTAEKRAESSQNVPITMQAYSAEKLQSLGAVDVSDLQKFTPGLNLAGASAGQTLLFGIRGVVQVDFAGIAESPVATYLDDGYIAGNNVNNVGLFDLDHIEVLKGPQGTLFGRNATGGVVSIASKLPTDTFDGYAELRGGSYGSHRFEGAFGGPITDTLKFRVAGVYDENGAWIDNTSPSGSALGASRGVSGRVRLEYKPNDKLDVLITGYIGDRNMSWGAYFSQSSREVFDSAGNVINSHLVSAPTTLFNTPPSDFANLTQDATGVRGNGTTQRMEGGVAKLTYDFGPTLTFISAVNQSRNSEHISDNAASVPWLFSNDRNFQRTLTEELRVNGENGGLRWQAGAYYLQIASGSNPDFNYYLPINAAIGDFSNLETHSYSMFSQLDYEIVPGLTLTGGIRGTIEDKDYHYSSAVYALDGTTYIGPTRSPYVGSSDHGFYTSRWAVEYRPNNNVMLYAQDSRGVKAGSFNAPTLGGTSYPDSEIPYKPEVLTDYEVGEKATFLNGRLQIDSAAFYYDYKNFQAYKIIGINTQVTNNPAQIYGAEFEVQARPVQALSLQASGSYTHSRVHDVDLGLPALLTRVAPYTSAWKAGALARYDIANVFGGTLGVQADAQYTGSFYYSLTNFDTTRIGGYTLLNSRLNWSSDSGLWEGSVAAQNITDKRYGTIGFDFSGLCGCSLISYGKPLWLTAELTRKF